MSNAIPTIFTDCRIPKNLLLTTQFYDPMRGPPPKCGHCDACNSWKESNA